METQDKKSQASTVNPEEKVSFVYKGVEYDASDFVDKHPGGKQFILNMQKERKDFTQYFKALHSEKAQQILLSFKQLGRADRTKTQKFYFKLLDRVSHLYEPHWWKQVLFISFVAITFLIACFTSIPMLSILLFGLSQVVCGWLAHSMNHSRNMRLHRLGNIIGPLLGGLSAPWWGVKHNMHHMFTNSTLYDDDIKHHYFMVLYPFLYLKWRFDSAVSSIKTLNFMDILCMTINYFLISRQRLVFFVIGEMIGGFYSANLLLGNHERQKRYNNKVEDDFIEHQIVTCRNYEKQGLFWLTLMGGMQYQTEHHLFPQIPFYSLPTARKIIDEELSTLNKHINYGPVL